MTRRTAAWIAWTTCGFTFVVFAVLVALAYADARRGIGVISLVDVVWAATFLLFPLLGAVIVSRRPAHPVGWLLLFVTVGPVLSLFCFEYARFNLIAEPGLMPGGSVLAWASNWIAIPTFALAGFLFLLFPTGSLRSKAGRVLAWVLVSATVAGVVVAASAPIKIDDLRIDNPVAIQLLAGTIDILESIVRVVLLIGLPLSVVSPFLRFRKSSGEERQQLKWFVYGLSAFVAAFLVGSGADSLKIENEALFILIFAAGIAAVPGTITVAILRYRLYDLGLFVNRTLVYGALTGVLASIYVLSVVLLQRLLDPVTQQSDLAIAASTLAVAALFRPLRTRVQGFIDRRFYRSKYDATRALEGFSGRLRNEVDLEALKAEMLAVVESTVQPAHVSLWLREGGRV